MYAPEPLCDGCRVVIPRSRYRIQGELVIGNAFEVGMSVQFAVHDTACWQLAMPALRCEDAPSAQPAARAEEGEE